MTAINVVTGGTETKFFQNLPENKLPESSLYAPAKEEIEPVLSGRLMEHFTDVDIYAEAVVKNALKANPQKNQYVGSSASQMWALYALSTVWSTTWVSLISSSEMQCLMRQDFIFDGKFKSPTIAKNIRDAEKSK